MLSALLLFVLPVSLTILCDHIDKFEEIWYGDAYLHISYGNWWFHLES